MCHVSPVKCHYRNQPQPWALPQYAQQDAALNICILRVYFFKIPLLSQKGIFETNVFSLLFQNGILL